MYRKMALLFLPVFVLLIVGCPGNRAIDREANDALWAWIQEQDTNGWQITGYNTNYTNVVVAHEFRPTRLNLAIKGDSVNPWHQRNMLGDIAKAWQGMYPANMKPRFNLRVTLYDQEINNDKELGWCEIDQDGNVDTHHGLTQDVM